MIHKKSTWRHNKLLSGRNRYYAFGDFLFKANTEGENKGKVTDRSIGNLSDIGNGFLSAAGSTVGKIGGNLISGGKTSTAGNVLSGLSNVAGMIPGPWGAAALAGLGLLSGATNALWGAEMNDENIAKVEANIDQLNQFKADASDFDSLAAIALNAPSAMSFEDSFIGEDGVWSTKAKDKANELREQVAEGLSWVNRSIANNAENITTTQMNNLLSNYTAFGGLLNTQGADFTNGLMFINSGGSHEENPYEGVQMGVDPQGIPNLVEEGETVFNDYVFSKRMNVPNQLKDKYKLGKVKRLSFADASKRLAKESEERPNDPISLNGLEAFMLDLTIAQELERMKMEMEKLNNTFAYGGPKGNMFNGTGSNPNTLVRPDTGWTADVRNNLKFINWLSFLETNKDLQAVKDYIEKTFGYNDFDKFKKAVNTGSVGDKTRKFADEVAAGGDTPIPVTTTRLVRPKIGSGEKAVPAPTYFSGINEDGHTWEELYPEYKQVALRDIVWDANGPTQTIYYDKVPTAGKSSKASTVGEEYYAEGSETPLTELDRLKLYNQGYRNEVKIIPGIDGKPDRVILAKEKEQERLGDLPTWMRYSPVAAQGIQAITDAVGWTNKPDYSNINKVEEAVKNLDYNTVRYNPIGNYLTYRAVDPNRYINLLNAAAGATRRNILNTSGGNRGQAMAGILAADNNYMNQIGELGIKAENENWERRKAVEDFNRNTNMTNSQGFLQAAQANQNAYNTLLAQRLQGIKDVATLREAARTSSDAIKSKNLSNLVTSFGNIGRENMAFNWRNFGINTGSYGNIRPLDIATLGNTQNNTKKKEGGKIKRKKKKGLTY